MMAKPPEGRFQSMDELIADLEPCLAVSSDPPAPPPASAASRRVEPTVALPSGGRSKTVVEGGMVPPAPARIEPTVVLPARGRADTIVEGAVVLPAPAGRPIPPRVSRKVVLVGSAVLGLTLAAIVVDLRRVRTGELLVQSDRADSRVTIKRGGRTVEGPTGSRSFTIAPGDYDVEIDGEPVGRVSVVRGERAVLSVREPTRPAPSTPAPSPDPPAAAPARPVEPPPAPAPAERVGVVRAFRHGGAQTGAEAVAVSADGRRAVTAGNDHFLRTWDLGPPVREVGRMPHDGPVFSVALSADGRRAASASGDRTARLWDLDERQRGPPVRRPHEEGQRGRPLPRRRPRADRVGRRLRAALGRRHGQATRERPARRAGERRRVRARQRPCPQRRG